MGPPLIHCSVVLVFVYRLFLLPPCFGWVCSNEVKMREVLVIHSLG